MKFKTIIYVKKNDSALDLDEPIVFTQNGTPVCAIESYAAWQDRDNAIMLMKLLAISEKDKIDGNFFSKSQLLIELL